MKISFTYIKFHNFLSFEDAQLSLNNIGYSFITGQNNCKSDSAVSNGSGKSTIFEALSWCITGETIRGTKEVKRISAIDECYVELQFLVDGVPYKIYRQSNPSKLFFYVNDKDESGKGIRDTEAIIKNYLPDLTASLIGSVIVLGQGLPMRFSNNSPAGRKEVLEKLSKSDFMIQDLKTRIATRKKDLEDSIRSAEDDLLSANTRKKMYEQGLAESSNKLANFGNADALKESLKTVTEQIAEIDAVLPTREDEEKKVASMLSVLNSKKSAIMETQFNEVNKVKQPYDEQIGSLNLQKAQLSTKLDSLNKEIRKLKGVTDTCPTCGQKLPNVKIIDTADLEKEAVDIANQITAIDSQVSGLIAHKTADVEIIRKSVQNELSAVQNDIDDFTKKQRNLKEYISLITSQRTNYVNQKVRIESDIDHFEQNRKDLEDTIERYKTSLTGVDDEILYINSERETLQKHYEVIQKMNTAVTRDFRGYLLTSVIEFINRKAKEYSMDVFATDKIEFCLDGNNIDISYDGKDYFNLSGGERQKIDLIVQFSIRDMLCKYLNFSSNILVLDEITDFLDVEGSNRIVNLITNRLSDVESVYIISHHTELNIPCDTEIVVIKDANGISSLR